MDHINIKLILILFLSIAGCENQPPPDNIDGDEIKIRQVHADYVEAWLSSDEEKLMDLLVEDSRIQPNMFTPVDGKANIRAFWFPNDSSQTVIHEFKTNILSINLLDTIAISTHDSYLDWSYRKDTIRFGMVQQGINTTLYRKLTDGSWKIWRSMWTDIAAEPKE